MKQSDWQDKKVSLITWGVIKRTYSQAELLVLALGAKFRLNHGILRTFLCLVGIIAAIGAGLITMFVYQIYDIGAYIIVGGYFVFALLAFKRCRYFFVLESLRGKLQGQFYLALDETFRFPLVKRVGVFILNTVTIWLTLPIIAFYFAASVILGMISIFLPFLGARVLLTLPQGYAFQKISVLNSCYAAVESLRDSLL